MNNFLLILEKMNELFSKCRQKLIIVQDRVKLRISNRRGAYVFWLFDLKILSMHLALKIQLEKCDL